MGRQYTKKDIIKLMLKIGVPVALQNLVSVLVNMLDTIMIGSVGEAQLGAINQVNTIYLFFNMFIWGISLATVVITTRYWGAKKVEPIRDMIGFAMRINIIAAALLSFIAILFPEFLMRIFASDPEVIAYGVEYLSIMGWFYFFPAISNTLLTTIRSVGNVKISVLVYTCSCLTNLVLNWVLIYGNLGAPRLEVLGAAIATATSKTIEIVLVLIYMYKFEHKVHFRFKYLFAAAKPYIPSFIKFGIPVFFSEFIWGFGMTVQGAVVGQYSKEFLAAYSLAIVVLDLSTVAMSGFANASMINLGNMIGAGEDEQVKKWGDFFIIGGGVVGLFMASIVLIIRPFAPEFIDATPLTASYISQLLLICAYIGVSYGFSWNLGAGILRAGGITEYMAKVDIIMTVIFRGAFSILFGLVLKWNPVLVMFIICSDEFIKGIIYFLKYKKGDWLRHGMTIKTEKEPLPETT